MDCWPFSRSPCWWPNSIAIVWAHQPRLNGLPLAAWVVIPRSWTRFRASFAICGWGSSRAPCSISHESHSLHAIPVAVGMLAAFDAMSPAQRVGSMIVMPAGFAWSKTGSSSAASARPTVRSISRWGCRAPEAMSAIMSG